MRAHWPLVVALSFGVIVLVGACVGDDPVVGAIGGERDGGGSDGTTEAEPDGAVDGAASLDGAADGDAERLCGYPGEDCCEAPSLPCRAGTTCGLTNKKCMVSALGVVGVYGEVRPGPMLTRHVSSAFYDGSNWTNGPDVMTETTLSGFSVTDLIANGPADFHVTLFKSSEGKMFHLSAGAWRKCEPGQACAGPSATPPPFWSVAKLSDEIWIAGTNAIYRCVAGAACTMQANGLTGVTTWATGKLVGTSNQDIWLSALTRAFHFDGTAWTIHPDLKARTIHQVRKDDVWVGDQTLQHWNGTAWSSEFVIDGAPAPGIITSISGSSKNDVWAAGYNLSDGSHPAFSAHWDGTSWSLKPLPVGAAEQATVYAPSPIEAFLACGTGVYRWNGTEWQAMTMPTVDAGSGSQPAWDSIAGPAKPRR